MSVSEYIKNLGGISIHLWSNDMKGYWYMNPSCTIHNGEVVINIRALDYFYPLEFNNITHTISHNYIGKLSEKYILYDVVRQPDRVGINGYYSKFAGQEDIRLISWDGKLYGICARPDIREGFTIQELIEYGDNFQQNRNIYIYTNRTIEKNWMPIEGIPFTFIYDVENGIQLTVDFQQNRINYIYTKCSGLSGSGGSQLVRVGDSYICCVHRHIDYPKYEHSFIIYNSDFTEATQTEWFKFSTENIEFVTGMCYYNGYLIISHSESDYIPILTIIPAYKIINGLDVPSSINIYNKFDGVDPGQIVAHKMFTGDIVGALLILQESKII